MKLFSSVDIDNEDRSDDRALDDSEKALTPLARFICSFRACMRRVHFNT